MNAAPRPLRVRAIVVAAIAIALARAARGDDVPAPAPAPAPVTVERTLALEDGPRSFRLHLPSAAPLARPVPLVVCIHGLGGSGRIQEALTGMDAAADARSFAVAYPDGRARMWAFEAPLARPGGEPAEPNRDVKFIGALVDALVAEGTADARRVYVTGISMGGYMTNRLALDLPAKIAAIAPVAGTIPPLAARRAPAAARAMPVAYFHGTDDAVVGYDGSDVFSGRKDSLSAEELVDFWVARDGCAREAKVEALPAVEGDPTRVERRTYRGARDGAEVVFYRVAGGGHTWPGGSRQPAWMLGRTSRAVDASTEMCAFFARFALPEAKDDGIR